MVRIFLAVVCFSAGLPAYGVTTHCEASRIASGATRQEISRTCGNPAMTHAQITSFVSKKKGEPARETFRNEKFMVFDRGPQDNLFVVALKQGKVVRSQSVDVKGTAGVPLENCFAGEHLRTGLEDYLVEYLCGMPESVELVDTKQVPVNKRVAKTVNTEKWSYLRDGKRYTIVVSGNRLSEIGR